ncbi:MAG: hypothetical protein L0Y58_17615 [Verrucomicrobia subdivision 3 bacterium]|nr:hypothetical protein [Limisphaerales bacterium]
MLQTEVQKPLTIHFEARNTHAAGWFKRASYSIAGFVLLWILVSLYDARRPRKTVPATA